MINVPMYSADIISITSYTFKFSVLTMYMDWFMFIGIEKNGNTKIFI